MASVSSDWVPIAAVVLCGVLAAAIGYLLLQRLRARRLQLVAELTTSPVFADDRAHNQIRMARAEIDVLHRDGIEVPRARELLAQADAALARRENVDAVRLARNAHQLLVEARRAGPVAPAAPTGTSRTVAAVAAPAAASAPVDPEPSTPSPSGLSTAAPAGPEAAGARPPKNRMEAHFQMTLLVEQLASPAGAGPRPTGWAEAEQLRVGAQAAYARADYTEALRLALRGRRQLGAKLETLPAGRAGGAGSDAEPSGAPASAPAAAVPATGRCAHCGRPLRAEDKFCRGCGASAVAVRCPRCQAPVEANDTFCGRCGSPLA